jgi:hypothetical protein
VISNSCSIPRSQHHTTDIVVLLVGAGVGSDSELRTDMPVASAGSTTVARCHM